MTCGTPSVPPLHVKGAAEQGGQLFLTEGEKAGLLFTKRFFPVEPWGCRGCVTFPGTLNVLVKRLLWQEPRRGTVWSHTGALRGGSWHRCWPRLWGKRQVSLVIVGRWFGFILEIRSSEPKPRPHCLLTVASCLFAFFLQYNYPLVDRAA